MKHRGPVCKECGCEFYYDYLDKPEPHEGTGLCWECWWLLRKVKEGCK